MNDSEKPKSSWQERRKRNKERWHVPFIYVEWRCEQLSHFLEQWALLDILGHLGRLAILLAVISYARGCNERWMQAENQRKAKQYQAWQVISAAQGKPGGGGRKDALEDLHKDKVSLAGVDISNAYLPELNLPGAELDSANLSETHLWRANLSGADLTDANLSRANLTDANLAGAVLYGANLIGANLYDANLPGADLVQANLAGARLWVTNLTGANLWDANLAGARLVRANLAGAYLWDAKLPGAHLYDANLAGAVLNGANLTNIKDWRKIINIEFANIYDVNNPPDGFIEWAKEHGAVSIEDSEEWKKFLRKKE